MIGKKLSILTGLLTVIFTSFTFKHPPKVNRPNVIILLADDLGYGDVGCFGSPAIETKNIDFLAHEGMKFTRFYAGSAVCSPSRASILAGMFPLRMDIRKAFSEVDVAHLPTDALIIPEILNKEGYFTAFIGKWHLGGIRKEHIDRRENGLAADVPGPLQQGFKHYLATIEGEPPRQSFIKTRTMYSESGQYLVRNDKRIAAVNKQWDEIKVDEAISIFDKSIKDKKPFFIDLAFDAPHEPYEAVPGPHHDKYKEQGLEGDQLFHRSRVSHLDEQIGRIYTALKKRKLLENTLIIFTSDNGAIHEGNTGPFEGGKTDLHEGGLRVPFIAVWKGEIKPGTTNFSLTHHADILPTILDAVNINTNRDNMDGRSLIPCFKNKFVNREQVLLFQMDKYSSFQGHGDRPTPTITTAAIWKNWKLTTDSLAAKELFNIGNDYQESYNLLGKHPFEENYLLKATKDFWNAPRLNPMK